MNLYNTRAVVGLVTLLGATTLAGGTVAQDDGHGTEGGEMQGMDHGEMMQGMSHGTETTGSPATEAYRAANLAMHDAMNIEFTDNADVDFARGMIGHHQGAIDMAQIVLKHGEDPELRQLAEEVIDTQEEEIAFLRDWIVQNAE